MHPSGGVFSDPNEVERDKFWHSTKSISRILATPASSNRWVLPSGCGAPASKPHDAAYFLLMTPEFPSQIHRPVTSVPDLIPPILS